MPRPSKLSVPTNAPLPHTHRLAPASPEASRILSKLSRPSLVALALQWLSPKHIALCPPYLLQDEEDDDADEDAPYDPAQSVEELREIWQELQRRKGGKREIVERALEGDWRRGVTLYQLAMAEARQLQDHPTSLRWSALRITPVRKTQETAPANQSDVNSSADGQLPRVHAQTFVQNLQHELAPLAKAHYYLTPIEARRASLLRIYILDSPYSSQKALQDKNAKLLSSSESAKTMFLLFPDGSPHVFVSLATTVGQTTDLDTRSMNSIVLDAVARGLSKQRERYTLKPSALAVKSIDTLFALRGSERGTQAQGGWSIFIANTFDVPSIDYTPAPTTSLPDPVLDKENIQPGNAKRKHDAASSLPPSSAKRLRQIAVGRFGTRGLSTDNTAIDRLDVRIDDPFPSTLTTRNPLRPLAGSRTTSKPSHPSEPPSKRRGRRARSSLLDKEDLHADADPTGESVQLWRPDVRLSFQGTHVFAGLKSLVEEGVIDGKKMPGWLTGDAGVSVGIVRDGRIVVKGQGR